MGSTKISQPSPPPAPSTKESVQAWADVQPQIYQQQLQYEPKLLDQQLAMQSKYAEPLLRQNYELQKEYAPKMMADEFELQKKYMPELTKLQYETEKGLYPETSALQEQLAKQAREGMTSDVPDWMKQEYLSNLNANLGTNIGAPIAADYVSRGLLEQKKGWRDYYRDLGLTMTGRLPLRQASGVQSPQVNVPQTQGLNWTQNFTPQNVMNFKNQGYGSYAGLYGNMYNANARMAQSNASMPFKYMSGVGNMMTGFGNTKWGQ